MKILLLGLYIFHFSLASRYYFSGSRAIIGLVENVHFAHLKVFPSESPL
jgi:hypothetical protein